MSDISSYNDIKDLEYLKEIPFNFINKQIGILVGVNMSEMLQPIEIVEGPSDQPFAVRYKFGWALLANTCDGISTFANLSCHQIQVKNNEASEQINLFERYCNREFAEKHFEDICNSVEHEKWKQLI